MNDTERDLRRRLNKSIKTRNKLNKRIQICLNMLDKVEVTELVEGLGIVNKKEYMRDILNGKYDKDSDPE